MKRRIISLGMIFLMGCASIDHTVRLQQPLGRSLIAGPGDLVLRVDHERNLENIWGKADMWGRKTKEGFSEIRFAGVEPTGEIVLARKDTDIITNETILSRMPFSSTTGHALISALNTLRVFGAGLQDHSIDCIIGRDVLRFGVFTYDGPNKSFRLTF